MHFIDTIKAKAAADKMTIVLPASEDDRTIKAAAKVLEEGTANPVIIGAEEDVKSSAARLCSSALSPIERPRASIVSASLPRAVSLVMNLLKSS